MSVRGNFPAQAREKCKQTPPKAVFSCLNFSLIWRCMLGTIFLHSLMEFNQKIYLNIGIISYDFWVSVCLELSVWASNRHLGHRKLDFQIFLSQVSVRDHFPAHARGILNRHLRGCRVRSLRRCLLETILLHRLGEY